MADLQEALLERAAGHEETVMPGYTHTQHAQPISLAFWLTSYVALLARDQERLGGFTKRVNASPSGRGGVGRDELSHRPQAQRETARLRRRAGHALDAWAPATMWPRPSLHWRS